MLALASALVFHAYYFGWFSWFLLQLTVLLPLLSVLVSLPAMLRARLRLEAEGACLRQEKAFAAVHTNGGFLPVPPCCFRLQTEHVMTGEKTRLRQKTVGTDSRYLMLDTSHAGLLRCTLERARVYDYLKLFRIPVRVSLPVEVLVKPAAEEPEQLPNLTRFMTKRLQPKHGGGFSEEHEMRTYRPGDPLRDVHWKLSVKTEDLIIREAQEPVRGKVLLTLDLAGTPDEIDSVLSSFLWLSRWLLEHETPHELIWIDPTDCHVVSVRITAAREQEEALERMLCVRLRQDLPGLSDRRFSHADWRYHIRPRGEGMS